MAVPPEKGPTQHYIGDNDESPEHPVSLLPQQQQQEVLAPPTFYGPMMEHTMHPSPPGLQLSIESAEGSGSGLAHTAPSQLATMNTIARDG